MLAIFLTVLFFLAVLPLNRRVPIFSARPSFLGLLLIMAVFVQIVPGLMLVSFFGQPMSYGLRGAIADFSFYFTYWFSMGSLVILFLLLYLASFVIDLKVNTDKYSATSRVAYAVFIVSVVIMFAKMASVGSLPIFMAIAGDSVGAAAQKARILKGEVGFGGLLIGYLFQYFHYVALMYLYVAKRQGKISGSVLAIFIIIALFYSAYDLQKYNFFFLCFLMFALRVHFEKFTFTGGVLYGVLGLGLLVVSFILLHDSDLTTVIQDVLARAFVGQIEGSYMIYNALEPDLSRIDYGFPLAKIFGVATSTDPASDVIRLYFPDSDDSWVNSNTYVLAHAWSIFGLSAMFIAPAMIVLNVLIFAILRDIFKKHIGLLSICIYAVLILTLRINNDFSYFFYLKSLNAYVALSLCAIIAILLSGNRGKLLSKSNVTADRFLRL